MFCTSSSSSMMSMSFSISLMCSSLSRLGNPWKKQPKRRKNRGLYIRKMERGQTYKSKKHRFTNKYRSSTMTYVIAYVKYTIIRTIKSNRRNDGKCSKNGIFSQGHLQPALSIFNCGGKHLQVAPVSLRKGDIWGITKQPIYCFFVFAKAKTKATSD